MDGIYMSIEIGDQNVKHTRYADSKLSGKYKSLTSEQIDEAIECFIKKCHALFEFSKTLKEIE